MIHLSELRLQLPSFSLGPVTMQVERGEFFALMGPTGSGKTLLLETLAGLVRPDSGSIMLDGREIAGLPPEQRRMGLVYQDHALFPNLTVLENITYGQRYHRISRQEGRQHAGALMEMLDIASLAHRYPDTLSGGEKQRTALARALACRPATVLLDEPLSSLDPQFREGLRRNLQALHRNSGTLFFMVTHDFVDALSLAGRAAVIRKGRIEQIGPTAEIFHRPVNGFVADFVGMKNILPARFQKGCCLIGSLSIQIGPGRVPEGTGYAALRPEDIRVGTDSDYPPHWQVLQGVMASVVREGFTWLAAVDCGPIRFQARIEPRYLLEGLAREGGRVLLGFDPADLHFIRT